MARSWWLAEAVQAALATELTAHCQGARVQKVRQVGPRALVMELHSHGVTRQLWLDADASRWGLTVTSPRREEDAAAPAFQGLLRKHLIHTRLTTVEPLQGTGVKFTFETLTAPLWLVLEWPHQAPNLLLVHATKELLMGAASTAQLKARGLAVGRVWAAPHPVTTENVPPPDVDAALLASHPLHDLPTHAALDLVKTGAAPVVVAAAGGTPVRRALKAETDRLKRLIQALGKDLERTLEAEVLRRAAERAKTMLAELPRGVSQWQLADPYDDTAAVVEVAVDPAASAQGNVEKLFHKARRLERTRAHAEPRLEDARKRLAEITVAISSMDAGVEGAGDQAAALLGQRAVHVAERKQKGPMERQPFRAFVTANGWRVLMGKSREENDLLTHKTARGSDVFLHARDAPGAHVILVVDGEKPGMDTALLQAAQLAAHFSEARGHGVVDVRFTEVKHVKRVAGTPGLVTLAHERVKRVRLGDPGFAALLATEEGAMTRLAGAPGKKR